MSKSFCESKSIRENVIDETLDKMCPDKKYHDLVSLFKILSDYNRVRIICALSINELCVCELSLLLDMSQSAVSSQLRVLRNNDIVKFRKKEKQAYYSLISNDIIDIIKKGDGID